MLDDLDLSVEALSDISMLTPTTEGFIGKTSNLKKIEAIFNKICKEFNGADFVKISTTDIHNRPEIKQVEKLLEDEFGFSCVNLFVVNSVVANAFTYPRSAIVRAITSDMPMIPTTHGRKYYDNNHCYNACITINSKMFTILNGEELTGIVLHEVGHLFDVTLTNYLTDLIFWYISGQYGALTLICKLFSAEIGILNNFLSKVLDYLVIPTLLSNAGFLINKGISHVMGPLGGLSTIGTILLTSSPEQLGLGILGVNSEKFSDSFANSYGYGPASISAFDKLDREGFVSDKGKVIEAWTWSGNALLAPIIMLIDPHPEYQTRAKMILEDAKRAANDPKMPRSMRSIAIANYKAAEREYQKYVDMPDEEYRGCCARFSRQIKDRLFGGKVDLRACFYMLAGSSAMDG